MQEKLSRNFQDPKLFKIKFFESYKKENRPIHVFYYEDLKTNATFEMERILDFIEEQKYFVVSDRDHRIKCIKSVFKKKIFFI